MKKIAPLLCLALVACTHAPSDAARNQEVSAQIAALPQAELSQRLAENQKQLDSVEERLNVTRARRDNLQLQAGTDVNKQNAVDGAEAELASLQAKRATLLHERHLLEGRQRELGGDQAD